MKTNSMENATYLFRERRSLYKDELRHSESRWSAIAQMAFIWMSQTDGKFLNIFQSQYSTNSENWLKVDEKNSKLIFKNLTSSNTIVEGIISEYFDKSLKVPKLKPDIVLINGEDKETIHISLIEVKTVGATRIETEKYQELEKAINNIDGYTCKLYYLMSYGHEKSKTDWTSLDNAKANIILWEDLFLNIQNSPFINFIGELEDLNYWKKYIDIRFLNV